MSLTGQALVDKARELAERAHAGQTRADKKTPFIAHPLDVESRFAALFDSEILGQVWFHETPTEMRARGRAVALCHDCIEDCGTTFEDLDREGLGTLIPHLRLLTRFEGTSYLDYLLRLKSSGDWLALLVKRADMASNLSDLHNVPSAGARKGLQTKYELAGYILSH